MSKTGPAQTRAKRKRRRRNKKNRCPLCTKGVYLSETNGTHHYTIPGLAFVSVSCELRKDDE